MSDTPYWQQHGGKRAQVLHHTRQYQFLRQVTTEIAVWKRIDGNRRAYVGPSGILWRFRSHWNRKLAWLQAQTMLKHWPVRIIPVPSRGREFLRLQDFITKASVRVFADDAESLLIALRRLKRQMKNTKEQIECPEE